MLEYQVGHYVKYHQIPQQNRKNYEASCLLTTKPNLMVAMIRLRQD
jgi:hypothetical protein